MSFAAWLLLAWGANHYKQPAKPPAPKPAPGGLTYKLPRGEVPRDIAPCPVPPCPIRPQPGGNP
jgi:hypothetical protein